MKLNKICVFSSLGLVLFIYGHAMYGTESASLEEQESKKYVLLTMLYNETQPQRINEYKECLLRNLNHPLIRHIHIFYDISADVDLEYSPIHNFLMELPVEIEYINGRVTYQKCFERANTQYINERVIVANADIFFNDTLHLLNDFNLKGLFITLTRWNVIKLKEDGTYILRLHNTYQSQDTWIFQSPIHISDAKIFLGVPGCDPAINFRAQKSGYKLLNPCLTIQTCHLHISEVRHYGNLVYTANSGFTDVGFSSLKKIRNMIGETNEVCMYNS